MFQFCVFYVDLFFCLILIGQFVSSDLYLCQSSCYFPKDMLPWDMVGHIHVLYHLIYPSYFLSSLILPSACKQTFNNYTSSSVYCSGMGLWKWGTFFWFVGIFINFKSSKDIPLIPLFSACCHFVNLWSNICYKISGNNSPFTSFVT